MRQDKKLSKFGGAHAESPLRFTISKPSKRVDRSRAKIALYKIYWRKIENTQAATLGILHGAYVGYLHFKYFIPGRTNFGCSSRIYIPLMAITGPL